jgi:hypothetical protein
MPSRVDNSHTGGDHLQLVGEPAIRGSLPRSLMTSKRSIENRRGGAEPTQKVMHPTNAAVPTMHPNAQLIEKLYSAIQAADAATIATCYVHEAYFEDIAFQLHGRARIFVGLIAPLRRKAAMQRLDRFIKANPSPPAA